MQFKLVQASVDGNKELAVTANQLESYIKIMYSAMSTIATDAVNKSLANLVSGWANLAKNVDKELGTQLMGPLVQLVKSGEVDEEELLGPVKEFRKALRTILKADSSVDHRELEMLNALSAYLVSRSDTVFNKAVKLLPALGEEQLTQSFVFETKSQKDFIKPLEKIVYVVTKERGRSVLTKEEERELKLAAPKVHKEYLRLRRDFNQVWKDELRNYVFESKKKAVKFDAAIQFLNSKGVKNPLPEAFKGLIDANGTLYTSAGKVIAGLPGPGFSIRMNADYDPVADDSYVFTTIKEDTGQVSNHVYTEAYKKKATQEKFIKVKNLDKVIDTIRKKWMQHVKVGGMSHDAVASTALELMFQFSARIGTLGNKAGGEATYGISTLLGKHVKVSGNNILIAYPGKDGVRFVHKLTPASTEAKLLVRNMLALIEGKGPKDRIFTFESKTGNVLPMTGNLINVFFKKLGSPVSAHKIRHVRGSRLFNELVKANEDKLFNPDAPLSEVQAIKAFMQIAGKVGAILGHVRGVGAQQKVTPSTAIQNYISPVDMMQFFQRLGMRPPKFLGKFKDED